MNNFVSVCTRDRAGFLARTSASPADMSPVEASWKLLVGDNGSSDRPAEVIETFADRLPCRFGVAAPARAP